MLSIRQLLTCVFQSFGGQNSVKRKVVSFHITEASVHDSKVMIEIPYEPSSYYIFDRGYNNFKMLYEIHQIEAYFVVRTKKNLQYKSIQWKRRLPRNVLSDASVLLTDSILNNITQNHLDWLNIGMKNKNENLHS